MENHQDLWTLQIKNVTAVDSGIYRCEAKNRAGVNFSEAEVSIKGKNRQFQQEWRILRYILYNTIPHIHVPLQKLHMISHV